MWRPLEALLDGLTQTNGDEMILIEQMKMTSTAKKTVCSYVNEPSDLQWFLVRGIGYIAARSQEELKRILEIGDNCIILEQD